MSVRDEASFAAEQERLGKHWTFLGLRSDLPRDNDWLRTSLGGRSIFVQRFAAGIRGFENLCCHRQYPLRTSDRGNGPVRCGFHHWQYDAEGLAIGIPNCVEQFGVAPRQLNKRLQQVELALCGELIFGRFRDAVSTENEGLEEYLGEGLPILQTAFSGHSAVMQDSLVANANWKFGFQISLDDYHIVAVHPSTFGRQGYLKPEVVQYFRFGRHSAYFHQAVPSALAAMARDCRAGKYEPTDYRIFQFFPNLVLVHFEAAGRWYVLLQQYIPVATDRTILRSWLAPAPFGSVKHLPWRRPVERIITGVVMHYVHQIGAEDNAICEQLQRTSHEVRSKPIYGRHEQRIAWFDEVYAGIMSGADVSGLPPNACPNSRGPDELLEVE